MEQRTWAYIVDGTDGGFCVGAHRGRDLESYVANAHGAGRKAKILWAETFRDDRAARAFTRKFRRWPFRRQAQLIISDQIAA